MATNVHRFSDTLQFLSDIGSELISENETYGIRTLVVRIYRVVQEDQLCDMLSPATTIPISSPPMGDDQKRRFGGPGKAGGHL